MAKEFGEGIYTAYRENGVVHVTASGDKPTLQTKVSLERLPFLIYPPRLGLFFDSEGITSPVVTPFEIEKAFAHYPIKSSVVNITDRHGLHVIDIAERPVHPNPLIIADPEQAAFDVYQQIDTNHFLIAKEGDVVPAIYVRVFGPDTYAHAQAYVAEHSATSPTVDVIPQSLKAWLDTQPGDDTKPNLIVTVDAYAEVDWKVSLVAAEPQGINPQIKLLKFHIELPSGPIHSNAISERTFRYEETPAEAYTEVTLENGHQSFTARVETAS
jgi:hypothetical protein